MTVREQYQPPADECEVCGCATGDLGAPPKYPPQFLRCCPPCRAMKPRERVAAYLRRVQGRFGAVLYDAKEASR